MIFHIAYSLLVGLFSIFRIFIIYKYILQFKIQLNRKTILFPLGLALFFYFSLYYFMFDHAYGIVQFLFIYVFTVLMIDYGRIRYLLGASLLIIIRTTDKIVLATFLIFAPHESVPLFYTNPYYNLLAVTVSTCALYGFARFIYWKLPKTLRCINWKYSILLMVIAATNALAQFAITRLLIHVTDQGLARELLVTISVLGCISFIEIVLLTIFSITKDHYKKSSEQSQYQLKIKTTYYQEILAKELETRKFRHDIKNLFILILLYNKKGEQANIRACINEMLHKPIFLKTDYRCADELVNAILSDKNAHATLTNTTIQCIGHLPKNQINPLDLCVIFGNLLDNAIEACEKLNYRSQIKVTLHTYNQDLLIRVENEVNFREEFHSEYFSTTKSDKEQHGFGIQNIKDCIEKYQGNLKITVENKTFIVTITLRNVIVL